MITCKRCGLEKEPSKRDAHLCVECANVENTRVTYYRQHQEDWIPAAKEQGLDLWLQQPEETQWEYTIWTKYRDSYPGKKPSYGSVAEELCTSYNVVKKVAQRWSFPVRMQAWMAECDRITMLQRRDEILNMNKEHVEMASVLRDKLKVAIGAIDPLALKPAEVASLAKLSSEMERKARVDTISQEEARQALLVDNANPALKKEQTTTGDLSEVLQILLTAGAIPQAGAAIGIRETKTTELVVKEGD